jgi:cytoplasmic iron level regulating protein YaaA (DUF328/UPF0246 family)
MKIIISPAKKMNIDTESLEVHGMPVFLEDTKAVMEAVRQLTYPEVKDLWKCNDKLAELNYHRFSNMKLDCSLTPAVLAYEGLQYQHMAPAVFTDAALSYIEEHLRILSGFYGVLKPMDGVTPYRLEMQARLPVEKSRNLYEFWGERIYREILDEDRTIINLASKEYAQCVERYLMPQDQYVTIEFGELIDGKIKQKGTFAKMARGEMVRFMAERQVTRLDEIKEFAELGLRFDEKISREDKYIFRI